MRSEISGGVRNLSSRRAPALAWMQIKNRVLGRSYELSLVFIGDRRMAQLNRKHRGKDRPTNVLAFALGDRAGEIFLNLACASREARAAGRAVARHVLFLYIHALLHLKGMDHAHAASDRRMRRKEQQWLARLS